MFHCLLVMYSNVVHGTVYLHPVIQLHMQLHKKLRYGYTIASYFLGCYCNLNITKLPYNCKSFEVEKFCGCRTKLENFHGWMHMESCMAKAYHRLFHWKSFTGQFTRKPQNFSTSNNLQYTVCRQICTLNSSMS